MVMNYLKENQKTNWNTDAFKTASQTLVLLTKLNTIVQENYKIHCLKHPKYSMKEFKSVRYSDKVSIDRSESYNHRIFVMEGGIVVVRLSNEQVGFYFSFFSYSLAFLCIFDIF